MISAVVLSKNEERNIKECLESLKWCNEIVVVDDYSTDKTRGIAKELGAKVFLHHLNNDFAAQRNFALRQAQGEWVLFLDADERISLELAEEIKKVTQISTVVVTCVNGFWLKRQDYFAGRWLKYGEMANVRLLRLARKNAGRWKREVHEVWEIKGKVGELRNPILHYPHPTISDFLKNINFYSNLHAQALKKEGVKPSLFRIIANPLGKFIQNYILKKGFLDGMPGLIVALMMSFHSFLARAKLWRSHGFSLPPSEVFGGIMLSLFFAYLVLFPFGQLARVPLQLIKLPEVHLYLTDVVMFLIVISWGIWRFLLVKKKCQLPPLAKPIFLFSLIAAISLMVNAPLLSGREVMVAGLYLFRWLVYAGIYFVIFDLKGHFNWLNRQNLINFLLVVGVAVAVFGLIQYILYPDLKALEVLEWDPHYYRVVGTFLDPGFTGIILALTLILLYSTYINICVVEPGNKREKMMILVSGLAVYVALALTYSRASWLAYLVGMGVISIMKKSLNFFVSILLVGVVTVLLLPRPAGEGGKLERAYSIEARIQNWRQTLTITKDHPIFGVGFNAYRYAQRNYGFLDEEKWQVSHAGAGADSSLLFVLATTGIFGFFAYFWIWLKSLITNYELLITASIIALLVHSLFLNSLFYPWIMSWMWILLATERKITL
jgi:glycosyltransferase involved in cell wall biosynthesis